MKLWVERQCCPRALMICIGLATSLIFSPANATTSTSGVCTTNTPVPLGAYVGAPNNLSTIDQAIFTAQLASFESTMNAAPVFIDTYINYGDPISHWAEQNDWQAASFANTSNFTFVMPVIALPLTSLQDNADSDYLAFASGQYDQLLKQLVYTWVHYGHAIQYWRVGWEMNLYANPQYGGDSGSQVQQDWIAAFQHVYTVMHQAAQQYGAFVEIIWNPGVDSYSPAGNAITNFFPGADYLDMVGADVYSDAYPFSYYDFTTGQYDSTFAEWASNPANLIHYYTYPAATQWSNDASEGNSTTLAQLISLAASIGKPFAVPETGAGDSQSDIFDNPFFPQWLSQTFANNPTPVYLNFVGIFDATNGTSSFSFSNTADNKPLEKAAWAQYFGAQIVACTSP